MDQIREHLERLVREGFLTQQQKEVIPVGRIAAFYQSPLGRAVSGAEEAHSEFKFSLLRPAERYYAGAEGEQVMVQGVIDLWFRDEHGITLVDFKSDKLLPGEEAARSEAYRPQLEAYRDALSSMLGCPVDRVMVWFFATNTAVRM